MLRAGRDRTPPLGRSRGPARRVPLPPPRPPGAPVRGRGAYRGPGRFRHATSYEVEREWRRYEGTPQRELLRLLRERFLRRHMELELPPVPRAIEVGPGPGRFTRLVGEGASATVLFDLSREMLGSALDRLRAPAPPPARPSSAVGEVSPVIGDAARWPFRPHSFHRVVALGNVVGFAGQDGRAVLEEVARAVDPGGGLVLESVDAARASSEPAIPRRTEELGELLKLDPSSHLPGLLRAWRPNPVRSDHRPAASKDFLSLRRSEVVRVLRAEGLRVEEQMVVAPLTGRDPELVRALFQRDPRSFRRLLLWEEASGRHPDLLDRGGHLLVSAFLR